MKNFNLLILLFIAFQTPAISYEIGPKPLSKEQLWNIIKADDSWVKVFAFIEPDIKDLNNLNIVFTLQENAIINNKYHYTGEIIKLILTYDYPIHFQKTEIAYRKENPLSILFRYDLCPQ